MDRFIDLKNNYLIINGKFKIQYGQIYSYNYKYYKNAICNLKSNMDRFIAGLVTTPLSFCHI